MKSTVAFLIAVCVFVPGLETAPRQNSGDQMERCAEVKQAIDSSLKIKPGTTRREVAKQFQEDGGANAREQTRYTYKKCMYIRINISFKPAAPRNSLEFSADDVVTKVSKPYLAYPTMD